MVDRRVWLLCLLALLVLGGCRLVTPAGDGVRDSGPSTCQADLDCPEDMYCDQSQCRFGLRRDAGHPDGAGDACAPRSCAQLGKTCGLWDHGCGGEVDCGGCSGNQTCNASGQCECAYQSCEGLCCPFSEVCFQQACCAPQCEGRCCDDDGCGGTCPDDCAATAQTCDTASCDCEGVCAPQTCAELGKQCDTWPDGCGGDAVCPSCGANEYCSGSGACVCSHIECFGTCCAQGARCYSGQCCSPASCADLGKSCGNWDDQCGDTVYCGGCGSGEVCDGNGACVATAVDASAPDVTAADTTPRDAGSAMDAPRPDTALPDTIYQQTGQFCWSQSGGGGGIPCTNNADCEAASIRDWLYCGSIEYCVQCTQNSHCTAGPDTTAICLSERCNGCATDADCLVTDSLRRCDQGRCRTCLIDDDCPQGPGNTGKCIYFQCIRCDVDNDCVAAGMGAGCDPVMSLCFDCYDDRDCSAGPGQTDYCVQNSCSGCLSVQGCTDAGLSSICMCVGDDPSTTDRNEETCPGGQICVDGGCENPCDGGSCGYECEGGSCGTPGG